MRHGCIQAGLGKAQAKLQLQLCLHGWGCSYNKVHNSGLSPGTIINHNLQVVQDAVSKVTQDAVSKVTWDAVSKDAWEVIDKAAQKPQGLLGGSLASSILFVSPLTQQHRISGNTMTKTIFSPKFSMVLFMHMSVKIPNTNYSLKSQFLT